MQMCSEHCISYHITNGNNTAIYLSSLSLNNVCLNKSLFYSIVVFFKMLKNLKDFLEMYVWVDGVKNNSEILEFDDQALWKTFPWLGRSCVSNTCCFNFQYNCCAREIRTGLIRLIEGFSLSILSLWFA